MVNALVGEADLDIDRRSRNRDRSQLAHCPVSAVPILLHTHTENHDMQTVQADELPE